MKKLILVRHGKSSWENNLPDEERPLKERAYKDAELVIEAFKNSNEDKLTVWSSYAVRALTTAKIFKEKLGVHDKNFKIKDELYTFNAAQLLKTISTCDDSVDTLMVFGHNPAMTNTVNYLGDHNIANVPTTGLTIIEFKTDSWNNLKDGKTTLYLFPKNLR